MATSSSAEPSTEEEFAAVQDLSAEDRHRLRSMLARTSKDINEEWFALQDWGLA